MSTAIKLIQLNIERSRHLGLVAPFLAHQSPDIVCIQELMEPDAAQIATAFDAHYVFAPTTRRTEAGVTSLQGVGIFFKKNITLKTTRDDWYAGSKEIVDYIHGDAAAKRLSQRYGVFSCDLEKEGELFRIVTTHFPWTSDGEADDQQREEVRSMVTVLRPLGNFVLCGDFNAPRGKEIFSFLAREYTDNVPPQYTTSIDGSLHRAGALPYMVDGLFSTQNYAVSDVSMICGVSDHCALVANISIR